MNTGIFIRLNSFVARHIRTVEMIGVMKRIFSFSLVSWMGPESPFLFDRAFNTVDAIILTWCAIIKRDFAYITPECVLGRRWRGRDGTSSWSCAWPEPLISNRSPRVEV